tara:strand:+ start:3220 stop:3477 length:258 start_codon:yes stop_codon:yes gene_type:complete
VGLLRRAQKILIDTAWLSMGYAAYNRLPIGICYAGEFHPAEVQLLRDITYINEAGERQVDQQIFNELFTVIAGARNLLILDFFSV